MRRSSKHRATLDALASAIAQANPEVASAGAPTERIRKRLDVEIGAALEAVSDASDLDAVGRRVVALQRVYLRRAKVGLPDNASSGDVAGAYYAALDGAKAASATSDTEPTETHGKRSRGWIWLLLAAVLLAAGIWVIARTTADGDVRETTLGQAFSDRLPDWVIALDRWAPAEATSQARVNGLRRDLDTRRVKLFDAETRDALGEAVKPLQAVLSAAEGLASSTDFEGEGFEAREADFRERLRDLNATLAEAEIPFFLDGDFLGHQRGYLQTVLISFHVTERVRVKASSGEVVTTLHLRRIDSLNWVQGLLGYTRESMDVAVVLTDKVEHELVTFVGPTLANAAPMPLFQPDAGGVAWRVAVEAEAGRVARQAFATALPTKLEAQRNFGAALERRRDLFERWSDRLAKKGQRLSVPGTLALPSETYAGLKASLPDFQVEELEQVQGGVESGDNRSIFRTMHDIHLRSVEKHEVQHRLDYARGEAFEAPAVLRSALGETDDGDAAFAKRRLRHAAFELSAYLSEVARDPAWSKLSLTLLARFVLDPSGRSAEWYAAHLILDGLAAELGVSARARVDGRVIPRRAAEVYLALMDAGDEALADAAKTVWRAWFGTNLPTLTRLSGSNTPQTQ
ncbi:MAG: hypothetical protein ACI9MR_003725 [Myxococcota bacterium]|jgi:hypothetical protein